MGQFIASGPVTSMYPGDVVLINTTGNLTGANLSQAVAPVMSLGGNPINMTIVNESSVSLTIKVAANYAAADFEPLSGGTVAAASSLAFSFQAPFVAVLPGSDPSTGKIYFCR